MEQARRDLMEADEKLALKRDEEQENRIAMDVKWQDLREKEMLLKDSFISFNKVDLIISITYRSLNMTCTPFLKLPCQII